jgi:TRAP-type C4-dicarboxylate transport system permease small subunit
MGNLIKSARNSINFLDSWIEKFVSFLMVLLMVAVLVQIFYRFIIVKLTGFSFPYTDEFSRITLIWVSYLIIGIGLKEGSHTSLELFVNALPAFGRKIIYISNRLLILIFSAFICVQGWQLMTLTRDFSTPTLQISMAWMYGAPTFGCLLVGLEAILQILEKLISSDEKGSCDESQIEKRGA